MGIDPQMDDLHTRMMRVTEDLRVIQRELNCAAMQAPSDPELMEALSALPETEAIQVLCKVLDQMRHFLWFYSQVMSNDPEPVSYTHLWGPGLFGTNRERLKAAVNRWNQRRCV